MNRTKLLTLLLFMNAVYGLSQLVKAECIEINTITPGEQIAVGNSIVRDAVMQGIYTFGSTMLNRYTNPGSVYYTPYTTQGYTTQTIQTTPQTTTVVTPQTTTVPTPYTPDTVPDQPEPMEIVQ